MRPTPHFIVAMIATACAIALGLALGEGFPP